MLSVRQVSTFFADLGGVERVVMDLCLGLRDRYRTDVLCTRLGWSTKKGSLNEVPYTAAPGPFSMAGRPVALSFPMLLRRNSADILQYHAPFPLASIAELLFSPPAPIKVVMYHHELNHYPLFQFFFRPLERMFLRRMDAVIVSSPAMLERVKQLGAAPEKCHVIPFGVDSSPFENIETNAEVLRQKFGGRFVLFVGRLVYYKGCEVLIEAMKGLGVPLVIVGEGPLRDALQKQAKACGQNTPIHFAGRVSESELVAYYKACEMVVLPSTEDTECFGLVQVEAMFAGKPVINTSLPTGVPWVSPDGETGLTVPPANAEALRDAIVRIMQDKQLAQVLGNNGRARARQLFSLKKNIDAVSALYQRLANEKRLHKKGAETCKL